MNKQKIVALLAEAIGIEADELFKYDNDLSLLDIGLESLSFVQFIVNVEIEFDIEVNDEDLVMSKFFTLNDLFHMLEKYFTQQTYGKKVLVLDCDNVLWEGVAGEEELIVSDVYLSFYSELVSLRRQGVLLCLCSTNDEIFIKQAFCDLEIPITWEDIICVKTNSKNKAESITEIATELNLSLDSFVFIDDSDYEIGLINSVLPEIETLKAINYDSGFFERLKALFGSNSNNSMDRTQLYREQKEREKEKMHFHSVDEYNYSLQTECICDLADESQADRISELSFRTNQFNLSGGRYSKSEVINFIHDKQYKVFVLEAKDKYGDMGIVCVAIVEETPDKYIIKNFMLSCRVFNRGFEEMMMDTVQKYTNDKPLYGIYIETEKNKTRGSFYADNGIKYI